jgi:thiol-disulfide isomerase/thioredoxin
MTGRGEKVLHWGSFAMAIAVAGFHGVLRPLPSKSDIAEVESHVRQSALWQGHTAPDIELPLLEGGTFHLADHIGKQVIILNFFATWCQPCRAEIPSCGAISPSTPPRV